MERVRDYNVHARAVRDIRIRGRASVRRADARDRCCAIWKRGGGEGETKERGGAAAGASLPSSSRRGAPLARPIHGLVRVRARPFFCMEERWRAGHRLVIKSKSRSDQKEGGTHQQNPPPAALPSSVGAGSPAPPSAEVNASSPGPRLAPRLRPSSGSWRFRAPGNPRCTGSPIRFD